MESPGTSYLYTIALLGMTFTGERTPRYVRVNVTIIQLISLALLIVATGLFHERSGPGIPDCPDRISDFRARGLAPSAEHHPCAGRALNCQSGDWKYRRLSCVEGQVAQRFASHPWQTVTTPRALRKRSGQSEGT